jgi:GT2 family glycosyltransferase
MRIIFVVLQYLHSDDAINNIRHLLTDVCYPNKGIILVDNGSKNGAFEATKKALFDHPEIVFLENPSNFGFAKGINVGLRYAVNSMGADIVVAMNDDSWITQSDFCEQLIAVSQRTAAWIITGDTITSSGAHFNPDPNPPLSSIKEIKRQIRIKKWKLALCYCGVEPLLSVLRIHKKKKWDIPWQKEAATGIKIRTGTIALNKAFIAKYGGFSESTFFGYEEDFLYYYASRDGFSILYTPALKSFDGYSKTVKKMHKGRLSRHIYFYKNALFALNNLLRLFETGAE